MPYIAKYKIRQGQAESADLQTNSCRHSQLSSQFIAGMSYKPILLKNIIQDHHETGVIKRYNRLPETKKALPIRL